LALHLAVCCARGEDIRVGDSKARVDSILGSEYGYVEDGNERTFVYAGTAVTFQDGKVIRWEHRDGQPKPNTAPVAAPQPGIVAHRAVIAEAAASSTRTNEVAEGPVTSLIDGDLTTRWSSEYSEPQEVILRFKDRFKVGAIRLHWEAAAAREYGVMASADGSRWTTIAAVTNAVPGPRVDQIDGCGLIALSLKLQFIKRTNPAWGFSLYEIEVLDKPGRDDTTAVGNKGR
jgi:hypothetical protein